MICQVVFEEACKALETDNLKLEVLHERGIGREELEES
jgi:hypothetical protein